MINITPDVERLELIDQNLQNIYQAFKDSLLIDYTCEKLIYPRPNIFDEYTYSQMILNMRFVIKKYNKLIGILAEYDMMPFIDINIKTLSWEDKGSDLHSLIFRYENTLQILENHLLKIKSILKLNGLIKEESK